jgi:hypothetical protein
MRGTLELKAGLIELCLSTISNPEDLSGICVEIGSFRGESANIMSRYFDHVICVDPYIPYENDRAGIEAQLRFARRNMLHRMSINKKISLLQMCSLEAASIISGPVRLVYIDGAHDQESVSKDIRAWLPKTRYIGGHDYREEFSGVIEAVRVNVPQDCPITVFQDNSWLTELRSERPEEAIEIVEQTIEITEAEI